MASVRATARWASIQRKISNSRKLNQRLEAVAKRKFDKIKNRLINNFDNHPVTQELVGGSSASNITDSLGGYGNLFSFIGFPEGSSPTSEVRALLETSVKLKVNKKNKREKNSIEKEISITIPTAKDFSTIGRMPYEGGNSWIEMIERGISSFNNYMHKKTSASRSGAGIQIKGKIRTESSKPTRYMTELLDKFKKELRSR
ncbi:hypothetical protein CL634_11370 [bacterium]|jgi:hypothetical protein|nr:hypothetical protein [bacterium]